MKIHNGSSQYSPRPFFDAEITVDLRGDLHRLLDRLGEHDFVSLASLKACMIEQKVKEHIDSLGIDISRTQLEAVLKKPRLFAILVLIGCEKAVVALIDDIEDDTFFFFTNTDVPPGIGDPDQRAQFFELQTRIPPILTSKDPPQAFPDSFRPPFTFVDRHPQIGSFSVVRKVKIATGHLSQHSPVSCWVIKSRKRGLSQALLTENRMICLLGNV